VESEPGVGTSIYFNITFETCESVSISPPSLIQGLPSRPLTILFAEDDRVNQLSTKLLAEKLGHRVIAVDDGLQALSLLQKDDFDLVLMDVQMPVMDGMEATRRIRAGEAGPDKAGIPIIALTAYAMAGDRELLLTEGMDGYLAKPVEIDAFQAALAGLFQDRNTPL